jgi:hypothetical protein
MILVSTASMKKRVILAVSFSVMMGCVQSDSEAPPKRPTEVPASAVWAGGPDGGSWIDCKSGSAKDVYECRIYGDPKGTLWAAGNYLLRSSSWNEQRGSADYSEPGEAAPMVFNFFDGTIIHLKSPLVLVPNGVIDYPFGDGHGKRQEYEVGEPTGPESEY